MARPLSKIESDSVKKEFLKALQENDGFIYKTCKKIAIAPSTHFLWMEKDSSYKRSVEAINEFLKDEAEEQLRNKIREKDTTSVIFYLKTKAKDRGYVERTETTGKDGGAIETKTETIVTGQAIPVAKTVLQDYEKQIIDEQSRNKSANKHVN